MVRIGLLTLLIFGWSVAATSPTEPSHATPCVNGVAEGFPCSNVNLAAHITNAQLGGTQGNDIWGWTDPDTQREYALMGLNNGTAFVDITDPEFPTRLGRLPTHSSNSTWRDIKTFGYYAFVVSEAVDHGMQVFDLRRLRGVTDPNTIYTEDAHYNQFGRAHNIVINVDSGFAYAVGSNQGTQTCNAGLHMVNISNPLVPVFAGCFASDGYTHDAQCVNYNGPDSNFAGREICFANNEDTVTIVDVTDKSMPVQLSRTPYTGSRYTHQGWLTEDAVYFLVNDELDEINNGHNTRTYVFNVEDLTAPGLHMSYTAAVAASDHNLYVRGRYAFESNYRSGMRIIDLVDIDNGVMQEVAFFDTQPASNASGTSGAWSVYPYFESGTVIISDISAGLFVVEPVLCPDANQITGLNASAAGDQQIALSWNPGEPGATYEVFRSLDGCGGPEQPIATGLAAPNFLDTPVSGGVSYGYRVRQRSADGVCASDISSCQSAQTTGACTAPPNFDGIQSAQSPGTESCAIQIGWNPATARCDGPIRYEVQRSPGSPFDPLLATVIASSLATVGYIDTAVPAQTQYSYRVRAIDSGNGTVDENNNAISAQAVGPSTDGTWFSGAEIGEPLLNTAGSLRSLAPLHIGWEIVDDVAQTGVRSYYSSYEDGNCLGVYTPALTLTPGQNSTLAFQTRFGIETGWDAGLVQISSNGGTTWQTIVPVGGYPGAMNNSNSSDACNFSNGQVAFTGTNLNWLPYTFNLTGLGSTVQLRWLFSTDGNTTGPGWWIDNVAVAHAQIPGTCTVESPVLFLNGFE